MAPPEDDDIVAVIDALGDAEIPAPGDSAAAGGVPDAPPPPALVRASPFVASPAHSPTDTDRRPSDPRLRAAAAAMTLAVVAVATFPLVSALPRPEVSVSVFLPILVGMFLAADLRGVFLRVRADRSRLQLGSLPLVVGLFAVAPGVLSVAAVLGHVLLLLVRRERPTLAMASQTAGVVLSVNLAGWLFHALPAADAGTLSPQTWILVLCIATFTEQLRAFVDLGLLHLNDPEAVVDARAFYAVRFVGVVTGVATGLLVVILLQTAPVAILLLAMPMLLFVIASEAYAAERQQHENLEFLYESTQILHRTPEIDQALTALLEQVRVTFRAQIGEVVLLPPDGDALALRAIVTQGGEVEPLEESVLDSSDVQLIDVLSEEGSVRRSLPGRHDLSAFLERRGYREILAAPLRGETRTIGYVLISDRIGDMSTFTDVERRLFATLAGHVSVSLENNRLERTLDELTELKDELRHQAYHDTLTGLPNRALFSLRLDHEFAQRGRGHGMAVLYVDVDDFKIVNDTMGHEAGDELLVALAGRVQGLLRDDDLGARLGGDEFALLLPETTEEGARQVAERVVEAVGRPFKVGGQEVNVRASVGVALSPARTAAELLRNADLSMYQAKNHLDDAVCVFEPALLGLLGNRLELRAALRAAIRDQDIRVVFQPLVDLRSGEIVGFEALARWTHPVHGAVSPDRFIPVAVETGDIMQLGSAVMNDAVLQLAEWRERFGLDLYVTVNVAARQFHHRQILTDVRWALDASGIPPSSLVLELTERDLMEDSDSNLAILEELHDLGVRLAIDDFGTGYSSLAYLQRYPFAIVKIAKTFVDTLDQTGGGVVSNAIIGLARTLEMDTIAEGVETAAQHELLAAQGCMLGQGWWFSPPVSGRQVSTMLGHVLAERELEGEEAADDAPPSALHAST